MPLSFNLAHSGTAMPQIIVKPGGNNPIADGDVNLYESPEIADKNWFDRSRRVIFINGVWNEPSSHAESARCLSTLMACPVIGVYNKSAGRFKDVWQCLTDKLTLSAVVTGNGADFATWARLIDQSYQQQRIKNPGLTKEDFVRPAIAGNAATCAMFDVLCTTSLKQWPVYAHSQGNLITCNALTAAALAHGVDWLAGREIHSFGSPNLNWPPGFVHRNYAFTLDPIGWLDYRFSFENVKVGGFLPSHAFEAYRQHDAEFVINRFRWGSFRMTFSMDEEGLAQALVDMGVNPPRLKKIFQRLLDAHQSDADDVALLYVQKSRQKEPQLRALAQADRELIDLLVECLTGGTFSWVTPEEKQAATYLKGLV